MSGGLKPKEEKKQGKGIFGGFFGGGKSEVKTDGGASKKQKKKSTKNKGGYVPPPPSEGTKIEAPSGMKKVKTFPVSSGKCPPPLEIPGVQQGAGGGDESSEEETKGPGPAAKQAKAPTYDDGLTPE